jgi:hypothetical protein
VEFDHEKTDARQPVCIFKDLALRALDVDLGKIECRNSMLAHQRSDGDRANIGGSGCLVGDESPGAIGSRSRVRRRNLNPSILVPEGRANRYDMGPGRHVSLQQFEVVGLGFDCKDGRIGISAGKENRSQPNVGSGIEDESRRERQVDIVLTTGKDLEKYRDVGTPGSEMDGMGHSRGDCGDLTGESKKPESKDSRNAAQAA